MRMKTANTLIGGGGASATTVSKVLVGSLRTRSKERKYNDS